MRVHTCDQLNSLCIPPSCTASRDIYLARRFGIMQNASKSERTRRVVRSRAFAYSERVSGAAVTHCKFAPRLTHVHVTRPLMYNDYVSALLRTRLRANAFLSVKCVVCVCVVHAGCYTHLRPAATSTIIDMSKLTRFLSKFLHICERFGVYRLLFE